MLDGLDPAIARLCEAYRAAVLARDVAAFMRLYDPTVRVFDAWGVWSYEDAAAWRTAVDGWFASLGTETVQVSFDDARVVAGPDVSAFSAIVTYAGFTADGAPLRAMQNRLSWIVRATDDGLRIVHEHTSAPIDFDHAKAILRRAI